MNKFLRKDYVNLKIIMLSEWDNHIRYSVCSGLFIYLIFYQTTHSENTSSQSCPSFIHACSFVRACMCVCIVICVYMEARNLHKVCSAVSSHFFLIETRTPTKSGARKLNSLSNIPGQQALGILLSLNSLVPECSVWNTISVLCGHWRSKLTSFYLYSKHFPGWAISLVFN